MNGSNEQNAAVANPVNGDQQIAEEIQEGVPPVAQTFAPAWAGFGMKIGSVTTALEAIIEAKLNWRVDLAPLGFEAVKTNEDKTQSRYFHGAGGFYGTVRSDNLATLGVVTDDYSVVQNTQAFSFLDGLLGEGEMKIETAGALNGGRKVWVLCQTPTVDEVADGDISHRYILFSNSHDGSSAVRALCTSVRVCCQNTLALALKQGEGEGVTIRHSGDIDKKLEAARDTMRLTNDLFTRNLNDSRILANRKITNEELTAYLDKIAPMPEKKGNTATMRATLRDTISLLYHTHPLQQGAIKGTAYALVNAVTQHVDHNGRTRVTNGKTTQEARFTNALFGNGAKFKRDAFAVALEMFGK